MLAFKIIFCYSCISYLDISHLNQFLYLCLKQKSIVDIRRFKVRFCDWNKEKQNFLFIVIVLLIYFSFLNDYLTLDI